MKFKDEPFEKRIIYSRRIMNKYKDRIPVIIEVTPNNINELFIDKEKYLVPYNLTVGQFLYVIRKRIKLKPEKALFIFFNNYIPVSSSTMGDLYKMYKDKDNFVYAIISLENTFG
jgi:GABA(A) receptor-associated protein